MKSLLSPRQVARAIGSSEASLKRWCDKGVIEAVRTVGGHRRIRVSSVLQFLRETGRPLVDPGLLGLPSGIGQGANPGQRVLTRVVEALEAGDEDRFRATVMELYLAGMSACQICDEFIAGAFAEVGSRWEHGDVEVYQERRGVEICTRAIVELRSAFPSPDESACYAFGGTLEGDPYTLPTTMAEVALREAGWRAESFGAGHPLATLRAAVLDKKPRLVWVSFSVPPHSEADVAAWAAFYEFAAQQNVAVAVGGRGLTEGVRSRMAYSAYCDRLAHLVAFAATLTQRS